MQKITPFLWFDHQAEEAARFYTSVFKNSTIDSINRYGDAGPGPKGSVMTVEFHLDGEEFIALNGGPLFKFSNAVSFVVNCETQAEIDDMWAKLTDGGEPGQCGWLKDKYGLSWQVVPRTLAELMTTGDEQQTQRAMQAILTMTKLNLAAVKAAYDGV
jgi:predicted 3-demethylubiquinone-9 3-methyltransferase (glyoxalase superfamily)